MSQPDRLEEQKDHEAALSAIAQSRAHDEPEQDSSVEEIVAHATDDDEAAPPAAPPSQERASEKRAHTS